MKIAVFCPNWVGDAVMATPAIRALRERFPEAYLIGVARPYVAGVLEGTRWFDRLTLLDAKGGWSGRWPAVALALRRQGIDLAILFPNSFRSALIAWLAGCRRRVGYARYGRSPLLTDRLEDRRDARGERVPSPAIDGFNALVEHVGAAASYRMELATTPQDEEAADRVWARHTLAQHAEVICLNGGGAFGSAKQWPVSSFARLARDLAERRDAAVLVLCGPQEEEDARRIVALAAHEKVYSLAGSPLSLGLTKACIRRADLLITTDSGPRHFAAAFDRPVITLFGPTHIAWTETYFEKAVHLQKPVACGPCQLRTCPLDHRCMTSLTPEEVCRAAEELLGRYPAHARPTDRRAG